MTSIEFKNWIVDNDIKSKVLKSFSKCFENYMKEDRNEFIRLFGQFDKSKLDVVFYKVELRIINHKAIVHNDKDEEYVEAFLRIDYKNKHIGHYSLLFDLFGRIIDDSLVWDFEKWNISQRLSILYEIKNELNDDSRDSINSLIQEKIDITRRKLLFEEPPS